MKISKLQYITNGSSAEEIFEEVETFLNAGGDWVQLRVKNPELDRRSIAIKVKNCVMEERNLS